MKENLVFYRHEADSSNHWKFKMLRVLFEKTFNKDGWAGEGRFWALNNEIAKSDNCRLDLRHEIKKLSIAADLNMDINEFDLFLDILVNKCHLVQVAEDGSYYTKRTEIVFSSVQEDREKERERKQRQRASQVDKRNVPPGQSSSPPRTEPMSHAKTDVSGVKSKVKESKVKESINIPADAVSVNGHPGIKKTSDPGYGDGVKKVGGKRKKVAPKKEKTPDVILFNRMKELWMAWFFTRSKKPGKFEAKEAASLSKLRAYFLRVSKDEADPYESAYGEFKFILDNWEKLKSNKFLYSCVDISMMLSKINDITNFLNHEEAKGGDPTGGVGRTITFDKA